MGLINTAIEGEDIVVTAEGSNQNTSVPLNSRFSNIILINVLTPEFLSTLRITTVFSSAHMYVYEFSHNNPNSSAHSSPSRR